MTDQWHGFTVSVRTPTSGQERESHSSWQEQPTARFGHYEETLWEPTKPQEFLKPPKDTDFRERVFVVFLSSQEQQERGSKGIAIVSRGLAEVYCGDVKLLSREEPIMRKDGIILIPGQAFYPSVRAEILFDKPGQAVELQIKIGEQTVKEVKIVNKFV
ncbi:MAG: hypothetical protein NTZ93_03675 [Candidatus Beckwithbacteria bacterium]|nr:hypothetical protein [Candidatus Beckwithbacteria bacterium]